MDLTKEQRSVVAPLLPKAEKREDGKGRPRVDDLDVLDGILWILRTGAPSKDLPERYPSPATCHRRFQQWVRDGVLESVVCALAKDLEERGGIDLSECFIDGTFVSARKGGSCRSHQAWQRHQDHGSRRCCWSSCRSLCGMRFPG